MVPDAPAVPRVVLQDEDARTLRNERRDALEHPRKVMVDHASAAPWEQDEVAGFGSGAGCGDLCQGVEERMTDVLGVDACLLEPSGLEGKDRQRRVDGLRVAADAPQYCGATKWTVEVLCFLAIRARGTWSAGESTGAKTSGVRSLKHCAAVFRSLEK